MISITFQYVNEFNKVKEITIIDSDENISVDPFVFVQLQWAIERFIEKIKL